MATGETTEQFVRRCRHCGAELSTTSSFCSKCGATAELPGAASDELRHLLQQLFCADLEFERELGRGGMGAVFSAFDPILQRRVAVKALLPEVASDRGMAERFLGEARTVAALQHPHVVTVYSVRSGNGVHAIVMEFIEGRSLDAILRDRGQLPVPLAGMLLSQSAAGLQHAHDRGVIHRDVKPANVLIDHDGRAIVSDFGIARRESGPRLTDTGLVFGTWAYMSPEQRTGDTLTPATDQYALGVMAFELLAGRLPFEGTVAEVLRAHMTAPPPSLRSIRPDVPVALENLINRMLAKNPSERWPSLREAERTFGTLVPDEGQTTLQLASYSKVVGKSAGASVVAAARRPPTGFVGAAPTARLSTTEQSALSAPPPPTVAASKQSSNSAIGVATAVVVIGAIGAWIVLGRGGAGQAGSAGSVGSVGLVGLVGLVGPTVTTSVAAPAAQRESKRATERATVYDGNPRALPPAANGVAGKTSMTVGAAAAAGTVAGTNNAVAGAPATSSPPASGEPASAPSAPTVSAPPALTASIADARKLGREFVTLLNQRRYRELNQLSVLGGDAALRAELIKLTERAPDFAAGFDRVPAAPTPTAAGFETEFFLDLEWRGGKKSMRVRLSAVPADGGWRAVGFAVDPA
jgi:serine/threonine protein kinase